MRSPSRRLLASLAVLAVLAAVAAPAAGRAQGTTAPAAAPVPVGEMAPDFSLPGATRYGLLQNPVRLADLRGQTVVIAFFYRARTKG
jgi:peroxiredoxin Q/BCP